jgi:hypothetical protein
LPSSAMKPLAVLGQGFAGLFQTALGAGFKSRLLLPWSVRSNASRTRRGRMWLGT